MSIIDRLSARAAARLLQPPCFVASVPAGFPSPADDYMQGPLDLNEYLVRRPAASYFCRVNGTSMVNLGLLDGCLLVVDRSIEPQDGHIIIAAMDGEITCKVLDKRHRRLLSGNDQFPPIPIPEESDFSIEGVVIHGINTYAGAG